jgi:hypothetical protein
LSAPSGRTDARRSLRPAGTVEVRLAPGFAMRVSEPVFEVDAQVCGRPGTISEKPSATEMSCAAARYSSSAMFLIQAETCHGPFWGMSEMRAFTIE